MQLWPSRICRPATRMTGVMLAVPLMFAGCGVIRAQQMSREMDQTIQRYHANVSSVRLGMSEAQIQALLGVPGPSGSIKPADRTTSAEGTPITILYYRVAHVPDGRTTDDELSPLLFVGNQLKAIGWNAVWAYAAGGSSQGRGTTLPRRSVKFYAVKGPLAKFGIVLDRDVVDAGTGNGAARVLYPNGLVLSGRYATVDEGTTRQLTLIDKQSAAALKVSEDTAQGVAVMTGTDGTVLECAYAVSKTSGSGAGICRDNRGNEYRVQF